MYLSDITTTPPPDALDNRTLSDKTLASPNSGIECGMHSAAATDDASQVDSLTANWPVPDDMKGELHALMGTHIALPLAIYKDDEYVQPTFANSVLKYALVEVHFSLKNFCIRKRDAKPFDSFTGHIEQIIVLTPGEARSTGHYKRKNILDGPYRPKPFVSVNLPKTLRPTSPVPSLTNVPGGSNDQQTDLALAVFASQAKEPDVVDCTPSVVVANVAPPASIQPVLTQMSTTHADIAIPNPPGAFLVLFMCFHRLNH